MCATWTEVYQKRLPSKTAAILNTDVLGYFSGVATWVRGVRAAPGGTC